MRVFVGSGGNDQIQGTKWHDVLIGLEGDDTLIGGRGRDTLWGGPGNDTFIVSPKQIDTIMDFGPGDRIVIDTNRLTERAWSEHFVYNMPRTEDVNYLLGWRIQYDDTGHASSITLVHDEGDLYYKHNLIAEVHGDPSAVRWEFYDHAL